MEPDSNEKRVMFTTWGLTGRSREPQGQCQGSDDGQEFLEEGVKGGKCVFLLHLPEAWHITPDTLISCMFLLRGGRPLGERQTL